MANRYWTAASDNDWHTTGNWATSSGGSDEPNSVPGGSDDVYFDSASGNGNCSMSAAAAALSISIADDWTGTLSAVTYDVTLGTGGVAFGTGLGIVSWVVNLGTGTWTVASGGDWITKRGVVTESTSTVVFAGTSTINTYYQSTEFYNLTIQGAATFSPLYDAITVSNGGTLTIENGGTLTNDSAFYILIAQGSLVVENGGTLAGTGRLTLQGHSSPTTSQLQNDGVISIADLQIKPYRLNFHGSATGYFDTTCDITFTPWTTGDQITVVAGTLDFRGGLDFSAVTGLTWNYGGSAKAVDYIFGGDVVGDANLTWTKGTGDITLSGTAAQSIDFDGEAVEAIIFAKSAGTATLTGVLDTVGLSWDNAVDAGILDGNGQNVTIGTSGLVGTNGAGATLTMGTGTWTCSGNWDSADCGTLNYNTSEIVMTGAGTTVDIGTNGCYDLTANGGAVTFSYGSGVSQEVNNILRANAGTLTIGSARTDEIADIQVASGATLDIGTSQYVWTSAITQQDGTLTGTTGQLELRGAHAEGNFDAGTYDCIISLKFIGANTDYVTELETGGTYIFNNDFFIEMANGDRTVNTNGANITFQADVDLKVGAPAGAVIWNKGTGTITLSGNNNQSIDFVGEAVEDIVVNKTAGDVTMTGAVTTDSFTGTSTGTGDFDPNGQTITTTGNCSWAAAFTFEVGVATDVMDGSDWQITGNFTADGQTLPADSGWDLDVTGTAVASGTGDVGWCTAGGTEINASVGPWTETEGNNVNWNFGAAGVTITVTTGAVVVAGLSATVDAGTIINATLGTVVLSALNAEVDAGTTISATTGAVTLNGLNPSVDASTIISPTVGAVAIAGLNATIVVDITITVTTGAISIAGLNALVSTGLNVIPPVILSSGIYGTTL